MTTILRKKAAGFSIIEVIIVISFFVVLSGVVLFNYRDFDDKERLNNVALDMALNIREMQVRALSARPSATGEINPDTFRYSYGVYVNKDEFPHDFVTFVNYQGEVDPTSPIEFWYLNSTDVSTSFACSGGDECIQRHSLPEGYQIADIDVASVSEADVSVSFVRPNPSAVIRTASGGTSADNENEVRFTLQSPQGLSQEVVVTSAGQIYTQ
jgi:type II secretory pathway pseudopilin PulG